VPKAAAFAVTPTGEALTRLTSEGGDADWSPDGNRIAFTAFRDRNGRTCFHECSTSGEIYVLDVDSGKEQRLAETEAVRCLSPRGVAQPG
jgi:Tol biopolymer transport system component